MFSIYFYPDNLKQKPTMWLWTLNDLVILGVALLISMLMLLKLGIFPPLVMTAVYGFLSIQFEGVSVKDFLRHALHFFISKPQYYTWEAHREHLKHEINRKKK